VLLTLGLDPGDTRSESRRINVPDTIRKLVILQVPKRTVHPVFRGPLPIRGAEVEVTEAQVVDVVVLESANQVLDFILVKVAAWMIARGKWAQQRESAVRQLTRHLRRVAREVHIIDDETGKEVRKYHAFRLGEHQPMLWAEMESITREQMDESKTMRRNTYAGGIIQLARDLHHFNRKYNPGDPIIFNPDFTKDIEDEAHSSDSDDTPADESESE
jgi:hypothetical protein